MTALVDYRAGRGDGWDELVGDDGRLRPAWSGLADTVAALHGDDLVRVAGETERRVVDDGVVYHRPDDDPAGPPVAERWRLDPWPLVMAPEEWRPLEAGLVQRAELLEALLADLYGPRRMLATGVLPAEVVLAHPELARPLVGGVAPPRRLVLAATDLVRSADGEWCVVADRTQAPSGAGFASQGRRIVSRVLDELHRDATPRSLAPWFATLGASLRALAPARTDDPRVVVLSPGPLSETAFDQSFVAAALGLPLVEGRDLLVRDGAVWLRSLDGPTRVHVVVRRVDTAWCDPLELRPGSRLGVPGLVEAARRGSVVLANALGTGVVESPALAAFLPAVCEELLGEELRLPAPTTWWCGDPRDRAHVLAHLDELDVLPVSGPAPALGPDGLREEVEAAPHAWVGRQRVVPSLAPRLIDGALVPAPVTVRAFAVADGPTYAVLPGGLARVDARTPTTAAKDVWVLDDPARGHAPDRAEPAAVVVRGAPPAVPRVLEDLFWVGRYMERAEAVVRLLLTAGSPAPPATSERLRAVLADVTRTPLDGGRRPDLLTDAARAGTVAHAVAALGEAAQGVRDQLSGDVWLALAGIERALAEARRRTGPTGEQARQVLVGLLALSGVTAENMVHDGGWHLLDAGRGVERAQQVVALLRSALVPADLSAEAGGVVAAVLEAAESTLTHRRRHRDGAGVRGVLDLLVQDVENPRSVHFSVRRVMAALDAVPGGARGGRPHRLAEEALAEVVRADVGDLARPRDGVRADLDRFLGVLAVRLDDLADAVAEHHFDADRAPRPFGQQVDPADLDVDGVPA